MQFGTRIALGGVIIGVCAMLAVVLAFIVRNNAGLQVVGGVGFFALLLGIVANAAQLLQIGRKLNGHITLHSDAAQRALEISAEALQIAERLEREHNHAG